MPGADVPAAGDFTILTNPTKAAAANDLEAVTESLRRTPGVGASSPALDVISVGSITPDSGTVLIETEGGVSVDDLDTINPANYVEDSMIMVRVGTAARQVRVQHLAGGSGEISLSDAATFTLQRLDQVLFLQLRGTVWHEVIRAHGSGATALAEFRAFLQLGSAALLNDGAVDAATLQGSPAAAFLPIAGKAADSDLLDGYTASDFARTAIAAEQTFSGGIRTDGTSLRVNNPSTAGSALLEWLVASGLRAQMFFDPVSDAIEIRSYDTATPTPNVVAGIRLRDGQIPEYWDKAGAQWLAVVDPGVLSAFPTMHRIRWDKLDPVERLLGNGHHVLRSEALTLLPGSGPNITLRLKLGFMMNAFGAGSAGFLRAFVGPNGDETDAEAYALSIPSTGEITPVQYDSPEVEATVPAAPGDFVSLVFEQTIGAGNADVHPSIDNGTWVDSRTYIKCEQIG